MKTVTITLHFIICMILSQTSYAQCDASIYANKAVTNLSTDYNFLKSYAIDGEPDLEKIEFSYVLTKGTQYLLSLSDKNGTPGTIMTLYDSQRNKVASNQFNSELVSAIAFPCNATGIYYIQYTFNNGATRCAGSALGFKR